MKKRIIFALCVLTAVICFTGCIYIRLDGKSISGNGEMAVKEVSIESTLKGVRNNGSFEVIIDPTLKGKAVMEGESNLLELMQLEQDSFGVLNVSLKPDTAILLHKTIYVRIPAFEGGLAETNGSGGILLQGSEVLKGDLFELKISGSGDLSLVLQAKTIQSGINGSGDIKLQGSTENLKLNINGSGDFLAEECATKNADISINGSGRAKVSVEEKLSGSINGSGDIIYSGDPKEISVNDQGSGSVRKR